MQSLQIAICESPEDATEKGYVYREPEYKLATLEKAVVVRNGTVEGNATVDLIFTDADGQKHVAMITHNLLKSIPA
jgi:hypothetical protein